MTSFPLPMFFVHIDKSGGLSVIAVLRKHFEPSEICAHPPNDAWQPRLPGPAVARSGNLTHFLGTTDPDVIEPSSNTVAHRLLGRRFYELMPDEDAVLAESMRQLQDFAWIGITELFEPSIQLLCETFGWAPPDAMPKENSTYDHDSNNPHLERVERTVPTENERELILQRNRIDLSLYNEARNLLNERMSRQDARLR